MMAYPSVFLHLLITTLIFCLGGVHSEEPAVADEVRKEASDNQGHGVILGALLQGYPRNLQLFEDGQVNVAGVGTHLSPDSALPPFEVARSKRAPCNACGFRGGFGGGRGFGPPPPPPPRYIGGGGGYPGGFGGGGGGGYPGGFGGGGRGSFSQSSSQASSQSSSFGWGK